MKASLVPKDFRAEGLLDAFPQNLVGTRILFPRAEVAREMLPEELQRRGANVDVVKDAAIRGEGTSNDYLPNFAQGHNYWQTFRYRDGRLTVTGCARRLTNSPAPTRLLTGTCPII